MCQTVTMALRDDRRMTAVRTLTTGGCAAATPSTARSAGGKPEPRVGARPVGPVCQSGVAAVRGRDELDDRQSEAAAVSGAPALSAAESLEGVRQECVGQASALF